MEREDVDLGIHSQIVEVNCRRCGRIFIPAPFHIYKDNRGLYCSYTCWTHADDDNQPKYKKVGQYTLDGELVRIFQSATKAGESLSGGCNAGKVIAACKNGTKFKGYLWRYEDENQNTKDD